MQDAGRRTQEPGARSQEPGARSQDPEPEPEPEMKKTYKRARNACVQFFSQPQ